MLKICNIESRRHIDVDMEKLSQTMLSFFMTKTDNEEIQRQWMKEFYDLIYTLIVTIKEDSILMNPLYSSQFREDLRIYEKMNGRELEDVNAVSKPYPLPFP